MSNLYKRFVTMCMISVSCILAWVYCLLEFKEKPAVIVAVSIILIASVYTLFLAIYNIRLEKDKRLDEYIKSTLDNLAGGLTGNDNEELERITKALYVQLKKSNTALGQLSQENKDMGDNRLSAIVQLKEELAKITVAVEELANSRNSLIDEAGNTDNASDDNTYDEAGNTDNASDDNAYDEAGNNDNASDNNDSPENDYEQPDIARLTNDFFEQFGNSKNEVADIIMFPGKENHESASQNDITNSVVDNASQDQQI